MNKNRITLLNKIFRTHPALETERLRLRKLTFNDIDDIYAYGRDPLVSKYLVWNAHTDRLDTREYLNTIAELYNKYKLLLWGIEQKETNSVIGSISFVSINKNILSGELGFVLARPYWNKGIMSEAVKRVLYFSFTEMQLNRVEAQVDPDNYASAKVLQKCGFQFEGIRRDIMYYKGSFHTLKLFSILRDDFLK